MITTTRVADLEHAPMYGRRAEMEWLRDRISLGAAGRGSVTLIEGAPGSGKSRLLNELARVCQHGHIPTIRHDAAEGAPLSADILDQARREPCVMLVDDIDQADEETRRLLIQLAHAADETPLLIIATLSLPHSDTAQKLKWAMQQHDHSAMLTLKPLTVKETRLLAASLMAPCELDEELIHHLHDHSGGRPDMIRACLQIWQDEGILYQHSGVWLGRFVDHPKTPGLLHETLSAQLKSLNEGELQVLAHAALQGTAFTGALVARSLGRAPLPVLQLLSRLQRRTGLIEASQEGFRFVHPSAATLCQWQLPGAERQQALTRLLQVSEESTADSMSHIRHLREAGHAREALEKLLKIAVTADTCSDHRRARKCRLEAVAIDDELQLLPAADRHRLLLDLARCEMRLGEMVAAMTYCRGARELAPDVAAVVDTDLLMAEIWLQRSRWKDAEAAVHSALDALVGDAPQTRAHGHMQLADIAGRCGRLAEAGSYLAQVRGNQPGELAKDVGSRLQRLQALLAAARGSYVEAIVRLSKVLRDQTRDGSRREAALTYGELGQVHLAQGQVGPALACFQASIDLARATGDQATVGRSTLGLAKTQAAADRIAEARENTARAKALMTACDDGAGLALAGLVEAQILVRDHCPNDAEQRLVGCRPELLALDQRMGVAECDRELGLLKRERGDDASARQHLSESLRGYQETGAIAEALKTHRLLSLTTE